MAWRYSEPIREDYDTEEEFQEAMDYYDQAENAYLDEQEDRYHGII